MNSLHLQGLKRTGEDYAPFPLDIKLGYIGNFSSMLVSLNAHGVKLRQVTNNACALERTMLADDWLLLSVQFRVT
jgi:hypothetical protein